MKAVTEAARKLVEQREKHDEGARLARSPRMCHVGDCPCAGTVDAGNSGRFACPWHDRVPPPRWTEVSDALHASRWLVDAIDEVLRISRGAKQRTAWVAYAKTAFANDAHLLPTELEQRWSEAFVWRLRGEISFRCGNIPARPEPRVPQGRDAEWKRPAGAAGDDMTPEYLRRETPIERSERIRRYAEEKGLGL